jgi:uncharacterized protein YjaZ
MASARRYPCLHFARVTICAIACATMACGSPTAPDRDLDLSDAVSLQGGSVLVFHNAASIAGQRATIERSVREALAAVRQRLQVDGVTIIVSAGTSDVIPEIGMGGRADGGTVRLTFDPTSSVLPAALETELFPLLAHELHHVARSRSIGYGNTLLEAMVSEGLADQFAVEVAAVDPPIWSAALDDEEVATWLARAREQWLQPGYDHDAWFFGTAPPIPRWAGYAIGFELTRRFLDRNLSRSASDLYDEPATSFIPPS